MAAIFDNSRFVRDQVLDHLLGCIDATPAIDEPFSHIYFENIFPDGVYERLLKALPEPSLYASSAERHHGDAKGNYVRSLFALVPDNLVKLQTSHANLLRGIAAAMTHKDVQKAMYAKLGKDLAFRYGVREDRVSDLVGHARPTLYRETEGFEIPPHPDTRKKVVTMHLYFPEDMTQSDLGTALYQRSPLALPFGDWKRRFRKVKQFVFAPNSGYAFVVNNTLTKKSWHGRETLPPGAGVRNTLLNTFYEEKREGFGDYFVEEAAVPLRRAA